MAYRWVWLLCILCVSALPRPSWAEDDEDDATMGPELQWKLATAAWDRREYNDAASLMVAFATMNPDHEKMPDAWWNAYQVYRSYRPQAERKKDVYEKAMAALTRWEQLYVRTDKKRAAKALWFRATLLNQEGMRATAIPLLQEMLEKFAGAGYDASARWTLAEWQREAKRYGEAATHYAEYRKLTGVNDQSAQAAFREGWCYQALGDIPNMRLAFGVVLYGNFNWGSGTVQSGALDAAQRLKAVGEAEEAQAFALKILEKVRPDTDIARRTNIFLGYHAVKKLFLHPHFTYTSTTDAVNLTPQTRLEHLLAMRLLVRTSYTSPRDPFAGELSLMPRVPVKQAPDNMTAVEGEGGKPRFTASIVDPNAKGASRGDWWYGFTLEPAAPSALDGLTVTRKWEKVGAAWGECTIRVQCPARWSITIILPNEKTNVNNFSVQPNEVRDGGKTFTWHAWYDLTQGYTIKFPVEVGAATRDYHPRVILERNIRPLYGGKDGKGTEASYETPEFTCALTAADAFPYTIESRANQRVTLSEIVK